MKYKTILVIPDTQFEPGKPTSHFTWAAHLACDMGVDAIVHLGDLSDHQSSGRFDTDIPEKMARRSIAKDYEVSFKALDEFQYALDQAGANPIRKVLCRGNHDERPRIFAKRHPEISDMVESYETRLSEYDWEIIPYQKPIRISGVWYCHMFTRTTDGRSSARSVRSGASSPKSQLQANLDSCTAGHVPGFSYFELPDNDGKRRQSIIAGSFYQHKFEYPGPQGNQHFNGVIMKYMKRSGEYDYDLWSIDRLKEWYG